MLIESLFNSPLAFATLALAILIAVTVHEAGHAFVAHKLGDDTAKLLGRMSLNPLVHLDPLGTLALLIIGFGWGKPVPVNPNQLKYGRLGGAAVSLAGPLCNGATALILSLVYHLTSQLASEPLQLLILLVVWFNILLMVFNLIPIPPLDGSKLLALFVPVNWTIWLERFGIYLLLILIFLPIGNIRIIDIFIGLPAQRIFSMLLPGQSLF